MSNELTIGERSNKKYYFISHLEIVKDVTKKFKQDKVV